VPKLNRSIYFKTAYYFPKTVRAIGAVFGLFGLAMLLSSPVLGALFMFITLVIFTTHYGFEIEMQPNAVREYIGILGFRNGKRNAFKDVEFIFIQSGKLRYLTYALREKEVEGFEAYLKFEGRNEMLMLALEKKDRLVATMKGIASRLHIPIRDYTSGEPITVFKP
jgi:hypothetical protein